MAPCDLSVRLLPGSGKGFPKAGLGLGAGSGPPVGRHLAHQMTDRCPCLSLTFVHLSPGDRPDHRLP